MELFPCVLELVWEPLLSSKENEQYNLKGELVLETRSKLSLPCLSWHSGKHQGARRTGDGAYVVAFPLRNSLFPELSDTFWIAILFFQPISSFCIITNINTS
jgi:hypothetical protein